MNLLLLIVHEHLNIRFHWSRVSFIETFHETYTLRKAKEDENQC